MDSGPLCRRMKLMQELNSKERTIVITSDCSSSKGGTKNENRRNKI